MIYPALYNGPILYYTLLLREKGIVVEQFEHYTKQTYRNRCMIMGPNGIITLSIPVKRVRGRKNRIRDIRIDYDTPWNRIHWRSLEASYSSSPFFEFMKDELFPLYERRFEFLMDLNLELLAATLQWLRWDIPVQLSEAYHDMPADKDPRIWIDPKSEPSRAYPGFQPVAYPQVFADRLGFQKNLSILDLLFNEGPNAGSILQNCLRT